MQLIRQTTDLDVKDALILQVAEATHHLASVLATTNERFWSFPTDRLLAVLNADVPATLATHHSTLSICRRSRTAHRPSKAALTSSLMAQFLFM